MRKRYPLYSQLSSMDCGPTCLKMICSFYGKGIDVDKLHYLCNINKDGVYKSPNSFYSEH